MYYTRSMQQRQRRFSLILLLTLCFVAGVAYQAFVQSRENKVVNTVVEQQEIKGATTSQIALEALGKLAIRGRAPQTGYSRAQFDADWENLGACDVRNHVLARDMTDVKTVSESDCTVLSGRLEDPYTGKIIDFKRGAGTSAKVQIDHVVAMSNAWQTGAQQLSPAQRQAFANDPLNLLAVDGPANQKKGAGDAATWLPPNKAYRCRYIARQIAVKLKYSLWVTRAENQAMASILKTCPDQVLPVTGS